MTAVYGYPVTFCVTVIIDREALAKQGDNAVGSVCLSVRMFVRALTAEPFDL